MSAELLTRRKTVTALAATAACVLAGSSSANEEPDFHGRTQNCTGPSFSATGPNAELYGAEKGYPLPDIVEARRRGDPWEPKYRVGAFTHLDQIYPTRLVQRAGWLGSSNARRQRSTTSFAETGFRSLTICHAIRSPAY